MKCPNCCAKVGIRLSVCHGCGFDFVEARRQKNKERCVRNKQKGEKMKKTRNIHSLWRRLNECVSKIIWVSKIMQLSDNEMKQTTYPIHY